MADSNPSLRTLIRNLKVLQGSQDAADASFDGFPDLPHEAFKIWLLNAIDQCVPEPHAMTVSTVDQDGWPDARVLILKNVDSRGWHFAVKADSPKGRQIESNNRVALTFYWPQLARQVRIQGNAVALPEAECSEDFDARPFESKVSALASKQSQVLEAPSDLSDRITEARALLEKDPKGGQLGWKVYAVQPTNVEFWQGSKDRLHRRLQYKLDPNEREWKKQALWP
ncbi:putative pyridoxamine 5'-phosphate oxidase [Mariannaea sp. PMI_226]|nr:putative pyridoxamine 5'-phosphate oxidase [Mariannaea sp. PMI_226]